MPLAPQEWSRLLKQIQRQRCVLMLGPTVVSAPSGAPLAELFASHLANELQAEEVAFAPTETENLSYIAQKFLSNTAFQRIDLEDEAVDFYQPYSNTQLDTLELIAGLPFDLIINTNPDHFFCQALERRGKHPQKIHYNFHREQEISFPKFSEGKPLVYNLFGALDHPESLVFTEQDRKEFIRNVIDNNPPIPHQLISTLGRRACYVFLGFDLKEWHYKLLVDVLEIKPENVKIALNRNTYQHSIPVKEYYEDYYQFTFIDENDIHSFVKELHQYNDSLTEKKATSPHSKSSSDLRRSRPYFYGCLDGAF